MKITFHSWLKATIGSGHDEIELPENIKTISDLASFLGRRHEAAAAVFELPEALRYVIDRRYVATDFEIAGSDAVEIYPPLTGG